MYIVSLKQFDGPLDLLLTLITHAKVDIHDIFVSEITEQYLESMKLVDELDMDSASEFLQMAATLLEIKSRAMLPKPPKPEDENELSPEEALIRQLEEYRQFKEISGRMQELEKQARALITKLPEEYPLPPPVTEITGLTLEKLQRAFLRVLERARAQEAGERMASREIRRDSFTVSGCMARIQRRLNRGTFAFSELFDEDMTRAELITMFMALLEMVKLGRVAVKQEHAYEEIYLSQHAPEPPAPAQEEQECRAQESAAHNARRRAAVFAPFRRRNRAAAARVQEMDVREGGRRHGTDHCLGADAHTGRAGRRGAVSLHPSGQNGVRGRGKGCAAAPRGRRCAAGRGRRSRRFDAGGAALPRPADEDVLAALRFAGRGGTLRVPLPLCGRGREYPRGRRGTAGGGLSGAGGADRGQAVPRGDRPPQGLHARLLAGILRRGRRRGAAAHPELRQRPPAAGRHGLGIRL